MKIYREVPATISKSKGCQAGDSHLLLLPAPAAKRSSEIHVTNRALRRLHAYERVTGSSQTETGLLPHPLPADLTERLARLLPPPPGWPDPTQAEALTANDVLAEAQASVEPRTEGSAPCPPKQPPGIVQLYRLRARSNPELKTLPRFAFQHTSPQKVQACFGVKSTKSNVPPARFSTT